MISKSKESVDHQWYSNDEIFVITAVGRLTNQKDFTNLINAFALTANTLDFIRLVIIGDGEQKELLQSLVEDFNLESKVEFLGFQSNPYKFIEPSTFNNIEILVAVINELDWGSNNINVNIVN